MFYSVVAPVLCLLPPGYMLSAILPGNIGVHKQTGAVRDL
jgi:hypothetical protein